MVGINGQSNCWLIFNPDHIVIEGEMVLLGNRIRNVVKENDLSTYCLRCITTLQSNLPSDGTQPYLTSFVSKDMEGNTTS